MAHPAIAFCAAIFLLAGCAGGPSMAPAELLEVRRSAIEQREAEPLAGIWNISSAGYRWQIGVVLSLHDPAYHLEGVLLSAGSLRPIFNDGEIVLFVNKLGEGEYVGIQKWKSALWTEWAPTRLVISDDNRFIQDNSVDFPIAIDSTFVGLADAPRRAEPEAPPVVAQPPPPLAVSTWQAPIITATSGHGVQCYRTNLELERATDELDRLDFTLQAVFALYTDSGYGTGFIVNEEGYAVTNRHVIDGVRYFDAVFPDGKSIRGEVIGVAADCDLALVKLTGSGYPYIPIGQNHDLRVGQQVRAIGTPEGLHHTVTNGIVSAIRPVGSLTAIQTNASINPGNSGGPLVDDNGRVYGVLTIKLVAEDLEGLGFAISSDDVISALGLGIVERLPVTD